MEENKHYIYRVQAYYDMNICQDEEIICLLYDNEAAAKEMAKELIYQWKLNGYTKDDADEWDETETKLYAYCDSTWNVDIFYKKQEVLSVCNGNEDLSLAQC